MTAKIVDSVKGGHNVVARVDARTSQLLVEDMAAGEWRSRSEYTSWIFGQWLDALGRGEAPDIRADGRRRGKNASEKDAMWQAHSPAVVERFKALELSLGIPRATMTRAAIAWHLRRIRAYTVVAS